MAGLGPDLNTPEQIAFSDDTGEPPLVIDHGKTTDAPFEHQLRGFDYTRLGPYGHDIRRHDVDGFHLFLLCGDRVVHRQCSLQPQAWPRMSRRVSLLLDADQLGDAVAGKALPGADLACDAVDGLGRRTEFGPRNELRLCFAAERYRSAQGGPGLPRRELPIDLDRHDCGNVRYVERLQVLRIDGDDLGLGSPGNQRQGLGDGAVG